MEGNEHMSFEEVKERISEFMDGLEELSRRTGVYVSGCGCCGSPFLDVEGASKYWRFEDVYTPDDEDEDEWNLLFIDETEKKSEKKSRGFKMTRSGMTQKW